MKTVVMIHKNVVCYHSFPVEPSVDNYRCRFRLPRTYVMLSCSYCTVKWYTKDHVFWADCNYMNVNAKEFYLLVYSIALRTL